MSIRKEKAVDALAEVMASVVGWAFCMAMLAGSFLLGFWAAPYFGGEAHREAFGILSSAVLVCQYEHRRADDRWNHINDQITRLFEVVEEWRAGD